jgi:hypothetical protein
MDIVFQNGFSSSIHVTEQDSTTITTTTKKVYSNFPENFFNLIIITDINDSPLCDGQDIEAEFACCRHVIPSQYHCLF